MIGTLRFWVACMTLEAKVKIIMFCCNRESPAQFENRIKPRVYVRRITRSTMYGKASFR